MSTSRYTYNTLATFNSVIVIESLKDDDRKTGKELAERLKKFSSTKNLSIEVYHYTVRKKDELSSILGGIENAVKMHEYMLRPIIHFEIHGNTDGIGLTDYQLDGEGIILWNELGEMTRSINSAMHNNLLTTMSVCNGFHLITDLSLLKTAPFWGIVGSQDTLYENDLIYMFPELFEALLLGATLDSALANVNSKYSSSALRFTSADRMLFTAYKMYFEKITSDPVSFEKRVENLVLQSQNGFPEPRPGFYRELAISYLSNKEMNRASFIDKAKEFLCRDDNEFISWLSNNFEQIYTPNKSRSIT